MSWFQPHVEMQLALIRRCKHFQASRCNADRWLTTTYFTAKVDDL